MEGVAALSLVLGFFLFILAILWILVPFAIFGIKPILSQILGEQRKTNQHLAALAIQAQPVTQPGTSHPAPSTRPPAPQAAPPPPPADERTLAERMRDQ